MPANDSPPAGVRTEVQAHGEGRVTVRLAGRLDLESAGPCWRELEHRLQPLRARALDLDVSQLDFRGSIGIVLVRFLSEGGLAPGAPVTVRGLSPKLQRLLETFTTEDYRAYKPHQPASVRVPEEVGAVARGIWEDLRQQIAFVGSVLLALPPALSHPKGMRWREVARVVETAGANALPVVALFSWLVGLVLALEAARPLAQLGAQLFIADIIGFASIRDTGPLVTAIMLAGRSGSAFAAELGTMKVNEELDALKTMGLEPVRFLVVQRVVGALLLTPLLAVFAMAMSIIGGVMVMRSLGLPPLLIFHQILGRVQLGDVVVGLSKSLIFGLIVGAIGCLRGLQTREGPQAVGAAATRSVVAGIILVILANTLFSAAQYLVSHP